MFAGPPLRRWFTRLKLTIIRKAFVEVTLPVVCLRMINPQFLSRNATSEYR